MVKKSPSPPRRARRFDRGFNLVILAVSITVLNILLAMALPAWSTMIRREKEKELIFRGLQYAEAIRVYRLRNNNNLPNKLTDLIENEPRSIRQLWHNPMAEDGAWLLVPPRGAQGGGAGGRTLNEPSRVEREGQGGRAGRPGRAGQPQTVRVVPPRPGEISFDPVPSMPFIGVASPEGEESLVTFNGSNEIREWRFTVELVSAMQQSQDLSFARPVHSSMFWRPFPPGVTAPNLPGNQGQDGQVPGTAGRPRDPRSGNSGNSGSNNPN